MWLKTVCPREKANGHFVICSKVKGHLETGYTEAQRQEYGGPCILTSSQDAGNAAKGSQFIYRYNGSAQSVSTGAQTLYPSHKDHKKGALSLRVPG
ncbi:uncharacterized [Tachysurus ichikawai]